MQLERLGVARRELLVGAAGLLAAALGAGCRGRAGADPALLEALRAFYPDRESAAAVGAAYLASAPEERDLDLLLERLCADRCADWTALARRGEPDRLFEALRRQHREDFEQGRVAPVEGWILSRTEARLCAVAALG